MIGARGRERTCQEAAPVSIKLYGLCGEPAVALVDNGDKHPYWMCGPCAAHNVRNRGAQAWVPASLVTPLMDGIRDAVPYDPREAHFGFAELADLLEMITR